MSSPRAVVWLDHQAAQFLHLQDESYACTQVKEHHHSTRQHASAVRTEHEFFGAVCELIGTGGGALIVGSHTSLADFRHYVEKHRPAAGRHIVGWQVSEKLSEKQLAALGRLFFEKQGRMLGGVAGSAS